MSLRTTVGDCKHPDAEGQPASFTTHLRRVAYCSLIAGSTVALLYALSAPQLFLQEHQSWLRRSVLQPFTRKQNAPPLQATAEMGGTVWPKTAVCLAGGLRTFFHRRVYESFRQHVLTQVGYYEGHADIFFDSTLSFHCATLVDRSRNGVDSCATYEKWASADKFQQILNTSLHITPAYITTDDGLDCDHPRLQNTTCCRRKVRQNPANAPINWAGFFAMERKVRCLEEAVAANHSYDFFLLARPDLYYFENIPSMRDLMDKPKRVYLSSKELEQPYGDYIYVIPAPYIHAFSDLLRGNFQPPCETQGTVKWPPEFQLDPFLSETQNFPLQVLPLPFVIARLDGTADCGRLTNEVWHRNRAFKHNDQVVTLAEFCELKVAEGIFSVEQREEPHKPATRV